jgi:antirestriction protein ArdC
VATTIVSQSVRSAINPLSDSPTPRQSVYEIITSQILAELEKGVVPWRKPWRTLPAANLVSKKPYRGINTFLLALAGYGSQYWLTYRQAQALGGNVRRGESGTKIVFWKFDKYETETADGEMENRTSAFLRYYTVFNLEQTEGLKALLELPPARPIESAEAIITGMPNPPAYERGFRACYSPSSDTVTMPSPTAFHSQAEYYSTMFHELVHSTGHAKRLAREGFDKPQQFGGESYSREELVAEMGSAMLCGVAGIEQSTLANSAAYLKSWIARLKSDSRLIISAASAAQKAADYIRGESAKDSPAVSEMPGTANLKGDIVGRHQ